ncbi:hypothetical protein HDV05_003187 [Chytridiales sp. JEL 0842]|nr:hypothetical protein HDV05_003187 [Chytridiales sp. JEL 0842]
MELDVTQKAKVVGCVARHVRDLVLRGDENTDLLCQTIAQGKPYVQTTTFAAVAMIDISGYSSLTSNLTSLGKLSSELITNTVGEYMDQVVTCISTFGGDIIKFLGDAILICFSLKPEESETELAERATYCCLYVSTYLKSFTIDLGKAMQDYQKHTDRKIKDATGVSSFVSSNGDASQPEVTLEIHVALTCGEITHVIMGLYEKRYDYTIHGPCMQDLGILLDGTKRGELGISNRIMTTFNKPVRKIIHQFCADSKETNVVVRTPESMQALCNLFGSLPRCRSIGESLENVAPQPCEIDINAAAYGMLRLFVSEALLHKLEKETQIQTVDNRKKSVRSNSVSGGSIGADQREIQRNIFKAEFRVVSVIFVKLGSTFSPARAQKLFQTFVEVLRKWEGTFQQFSVDDKGQTMLACFGLPPWTHERDALYALKAAVEFEQACKDLKTVGDISISVATGDLLFSKLGNDARSDASLLGDAVNVGARLMSLGNTFDGYTEPLVVKCDAATYALTKEDFTHIPLGLKTLKGKSNAIEVFAVKSKGDFKNNAALMPALRQEEDRRTFGYKAERQILVDALHSWLDAEGGQTLIIEGKSGTGKSKLLDFVTQRATEAGVLYWPLPENAPAILQQISQTPSIKKIEISGLTPADVNEMLVYKFDEFGVKEISPRVSKALKSDFFDVFYVVDKKTLEFRSTIGEKKLEAVCAVDLAVMRQFDQLSPQFQMILRSASIFGQYFDLSDLACCMNLEATPEELTHMIQSQDKYQYLVKHDSGPYAYYFRHIQIMNAIYDSQSFSERAESHLNAAEYFEEMINEANRELILPFLAYHYKKTDVQFLDKQIQYIEELADLRYTKSYYVESMNCFETLLAIAETASADIINKQQSAYWLAKCTDCRVQSNIITQHELDLVLQALQQIDRPFAKDAKNAKGELLGALWRLYRAWQRTKGGSRPLRTGFWLTARKRVGPDSNKGFDMMPRIDVTEYTAYQAIYRMIVYSVIVPKDAVGLLYIKLLTFTVVHGYRDKVRFAGVLYQLCYGFIWAVPPLANFLFNHGCKMERNMSTSNDEDDLKAMEEWYFFKGINLMNFGRVSEARVCLEKFLSYQADYTSFDAALVEATKIPSPSQFDIIAILAIRRLITTTNDIEQTKIIFDQIGDAIPRSLDENGRELIVTLTTQPSQIWIQYLENNIREMLPHFKKLARTFLIPKLPVGPGQNETILQLTLQLLVMYVGQTSNAEPKTRYRWTEDELAQINEALKIVTKTIELFANLDLGLFKWSNILVKSAQLLFEKKSAKALRLITASLKTKDGKLLEELVALRANTFAYLGLLLPHSIERLRYYNNALDIYKKHGNVLATKWLESIDVTSGPVECL